MVVISDCENVMLVHTSLTNVLLSLSKINVDVRENGVLDYKTREINKAHLKLYSYGDYKRVFIRLCKESQTVSLARGATEKELLK